jgi:Nif-specific regulatory protein
MVASGQFREDLLYRLRVIHIQVPPLRERKEDVAVLVQHMITKANRTVTFSAEALRTLERYRWPGNVRELKNVIERAVVLARTDFIDGEDLNLSSIATVGESGDVVSPKSTFEPLSLDEVERRHIHATLRATGWNKSRTAAILGVERSTLDRKIRRYDLKPPVARADEWQAE